MDVIADLQLHSRFSRAVSKEMTLANISAWAKRKGIGLVATGDWTHPMWYREIERDLEETGTGLLKLKQGAGVAHTNFDPSPIPSRNKDTHSINSNPLGSGSGQNLTSSPISGDPLFLLATEVSCIYSQAGKGRRIHILVWVPTVESARKISQEMTKRGCNLLSDGRPIIGLTAIDITELVFTIEPKALVIPAHVWTPWFSLYGSMSGFNSIDEAFGKYGKYIFAVETGLSSSPDMNWRIKELDSRAILSFSDAHSGPKIGREATVFEIPEGKLSYDAIYQAIRNRSDVSRDENFLDPLPASSKKNKQTDVKLAEAESQVKTVKLEKRSAKISSLTIPNNQIPPTINQQPHIAYTIEFHPEEGKYHYTGHRICKIRYNSEEVKKNGMTCPVCGKALTQGVMQRVEELAGRSEAELQVSGVKRQVSSDGTELNMTKSNAFPQRPPFVMLVPLVEIISECIGSPAISRVTQRVYNSLTDSLGGEFDVLLTASKAGIARVGGEKVAEGVLLARAGDITVEPGYDGVFGIVKIWGEGEKSLVDSSKEQLSIF
ncbi:hypothetical protein A2154_03420 [Candidatus Gottesmanbacteria bacterium RBG_16_43_7]|uniref:DNA helicase UvrD n=1 Tax=Candidatus Gottesmanbacteria bacterium RBG_16_43_7 TaxID=1798373 RepID=A0A1F5Z9C5_9BACT|nr:MAG: hypothetical protein A2154_03420 [Candidatus Gottesmanbacteria bacterium RBG_16_43_7]